MCIPINKSSTLLASTKKINFTQNGLLLLWSSANFYPLSHVISWVLNLPNHGMSFSNAPVNFFYFCKHVLAFAHIFVPVSRHKSVLYRNSNSISVLVSVILNKIFIFWKFSSLLQPGELSCKCSSCSFC